MRTDLMNRFFLAALLGTGLVACGDDSDDATPGTDTGVTDTGGTTDTTEPGGETIVVSGDINESVTWTTGNTYVLDSIVLVRDGAVLTIEPGVMVMGRDGSALVIASDGRIEANGTAQAPIIMTSSKPVGSREAGDWGGVVMLGLAPINQGTDIIEGVDPTIYGDDVRFGGNDANHNCGTLRYVRIEFVGYTFGQDNELNGLTLGGCGRGTTLEYIQVHQGLDDGIEFFGGTANLKYAVVSGAQDDSLDWDEGYQGYVQFFVAMQTPTGDNGIEADNWNDDYNATPRSEPWVYNATFIGSGNNPEQRGAHFRRGTGVIMQNAIFMNFQRVGITVEHDETAQEFLDGNSLLRYSLFFNNGPDGNTHFNAARIENGFDPVAAFTAAEGNVIGQDPMLPSVNFSSPNLVPPATSPAAAGSPNIPSDAFFDGTANYIGAFRPGGENWMAGWTAFPEN